MGFQRPLVPVGPGRTVAVPAGARDDVIGYPVQPAKVQRPPLRDETLARDRLLDWLNVKIHHRVVVITAEAGYGKTTLLADFSRRTRHRTLWYRLDEEDRNWVAFLSYLVAAGREHDHDFAPTTFGLLRETGATGPSPESVIETFVREFQTLGELGAVLILDDYHVVDDSPDVRQIVGQLLERAPERVTFVFSTRRRPSIRVARLRGRGEVAELTTDDLRFSDSETEQLFRDTYRRPLEPDVLDDLSRRTEGWAASLQLVQAALRDRTASQIRTFVRNLSGAEGDLYDYFAEEVVGDLDDRLQDFLMRTSILDSVDPELAQVVTRSSSDEIKSHIDRAESLGLLSRRSDGNRRVERYHPLLREFLEHRLLRSIGSSRLRDLHRVIADRARAIGDWRQACHHLAAAGELDQLQSALGDAVQEIMGDGQYALAHSFLERYPSLKSHPTFDIVRSRMAFARGDWPEANILASRAIDGAPRSDAAKMNGVSLAFMTGDVDRAAMMAAELAVSGTDPLQRRMARSMVAGAEASRDGDLVAAADQFESLANELAKAGRAHQQGIAYLNASEMRRPIGDARPVLSLAGAAIGLLEHSAAQGEAATARLLRAWAQADLGRWDEVVKELATIDRIAIPSIRSECHLMAADIHIAYGDEHEAQRHLDTCWDVASLISDQLVGWNMAAAALKLRVGDVAAADRLLARVDRHVLTSLAGSALNIRTLELRVSVAMGRATAERFNAARKLAERQRSQLYIDQVELLQGFVSNANAWDGAVARCLERRSSAATIQATLIASRLHALSPNTVALVEMEALRRSIPWRASLRREADTPTSLARFHAAAILDVVGSAEDVPRLRALSRSDRGSRQLGKRLARALAPKVTVEDLGRVHIRTGDRLVFGTSIRRKVLACLVFLGSRPALSATRDQVLDALWPDLSPEIAVNSLNQTIYFLRRVFEPGYNEDLSPEYVHHDSDVLWLDQDLVRARSAECWALVRRIQGPPTPQEVEELCNLYTGRFALDFAYEDWAASYRDALHAAFLQIVETAVADDIRSGHFDRGVKIARRALEIDPDAEQIELSLLRLYRRTGAHAAAAEQYAHYSAVLRSELGVEPPPFESL
jgi:LuxR family maltose regulon positive regulatory protein